MRECENVFIDPSFRNFL